MASFVSAVNLHCDCPPSLLKALADTHSNREIWLESFFEEKHGIQSLDTYTKITLGEYHALREKGAPRAIPTMCVLTIKKDEHLRPLRAKSRIVVLGNHEDRPWSKSNNLLPFSIRTPFVFSRVWPLLLVAPFIRAIEKTLSARVFSLLMRSLSSVLLAAILRPNQTSIGC